MESRNSPEIPPKFSVRAGDLLLICALCRTNFAEAARMPPTMLRPPHLGKLLRRQRDHAWFLSRAHGRAARSGYYARVSTRVFLRVTPRRPVGHPAEASLDALLNAIRSKPEARVRLPGPSCQRLR